MSIHERRNAARPAAPEVQAVLGPLVPSARRAPARGREALRGVTSFVDSLSCILDIPLRRVSRTPELIRALPRRAEDVMLRRRSVGIAEPGTDLLTNHTRIIVTASSGHSSSRARSPRQPVVNALIKFVTHICLNLRAACDQPSAFADLVDGRRCCHRAAVGVHHAHLGVPCPDVALDGEPFRGHLVLARPRSWN